MPFWDRSKKADTPNELADVKEIDKVADVEAVEFHAPKDTEYEFEENTAEEKALVRKIDLYLMPTVWLLYL